MARVFRIRSAGLLSCAAVLLTGAAGSAQTARLGTPGDTRPDNEVFWATGAPPTGSEPGPSLLPAAGTLEPAQSGPALTPDPTPAEVAVPPDDGSPFLLPIGFAGGRVFSGDLDVTRARFSFSSPLFIRPGPEGREPDTVVAADVDVGFDFLSGRTRLDLPSTLYAAGGGLTFIKRVNERWGLTGNVAVNYQADGRASREVIRVSGAGFATWRRSEATSWVFGVAVTGQENFPVLPFAGVTWNPTDDWQVSLGVPATRVSRRLRCFGRDDTWVYGGLGVGGGSYAVRRPDGTDDVLTLNEFPVVLGVERRGAVTWFVEVGYVFSRELEFERANLSENLDDAFSVRAGWSF